MASHNFKNFDGLLTNTVSHLQDFSAKTCLPLTSVFKAAWLLHRYIYEGSSLVEIVDLDADFNIISESSYSVDESVSFLQICKGQEPLGNNGLDTNTIEYLDGSKFFLGNRGHLSCGLHTQRNGSDVITTSNIIAIISIEGISIKLKFLVDRINYDKSTAIRYWHTFDTILQCIVKNASQTPYEADFLSNHDRDQIVALNTPIPADAEEQTICGLFNAHVQKQPRAPAMYAWDGEMTYTELDDAAARVAVELDSFGVTRGSFVPFCMEKSKWALVAALAILKVGAALVPMDPAWPKQRVTAVLETTDATVVVCSNDTRSCFNDLCIRPFVLSLGTNNKESERHLPPLGPVPGDVAFILFSSGSTGVPKGMVREHRTACAGSLAHAKAMHIDSTSRVLQFANHVFDVAMLDFFTTLVVGGCVCIPSEHDRRNSLAAFIQQSQSNWVLLTPTVAGMLDPVTVPTLRDVTLGGEAITSELLAKWLPHCRVGINYGSAEVDVTHTRDVDTPQDPANLGKKLSSCVTYVVDPSNVNKMLPIGAVGELLVSGPTMARSYLKQPERTAASFISAPVDWYMTDPDGTRRHWMSRAYRMGDLVQQEWDGSFRFVGRRDFQVKIRGQKVELGEIESQLVTHPSIQLCAVLYPRSGPFAERLVAIVEPRRNGFRNGSASPILGLEEIKRYLSKRVTSYMLPQLCVLVEQMPLTPTLKLDRTKLLSWLVEQDTISASGNVFQSISAALQGPELSPTDHTAIKLSTMIANLVTTEHSEYWYTIQGHDNFFSQIGLDSVQIMQLSHLISKTFARKVSVETLTDQQMSVKHLSAIIDKLSTIDHNTSVNGMTSKILRMKLSQALSEVRSVYEDSINKHTNNGTFVTAQPITYVRNVFLTGATGYLGIQMLRILLESAKFGKVFALVRSANLIQARSRLAKAAEAANWSIEPYFERLEIWHGDLSRTCLGLESSQWTQLTQYNPEDLQIDCFIHCGAVVDWTRSYDDLKTSNVDSTVQLLNAILERQCPAHFIYVSGGQYFRPGDDGGHSALAENIDEAAASNGYAQTKFVSEQIVKSVQYRFNKLGNRSLSFDVVKPAYLIGTIRDGTANVNDYLWRIVSASVRQKCYNADEDDQWLLAADVGAVADAIVKLVVSTPPLMAGRPSRKILHGLKVRDFWSIVGNVTGYDLLPVSSQCWLRDVKAAMEVDSKHVLWPLLDAVEQNSGLLTNQRLLANEMQGNKEAVSIAGAVRKNVEHLVAIGFLPRMIQ